MKKNLLAGWQETTMLLSKQELTKKKEERKEGHYCTKKHMHSYFLYLCVFTKDQKNGLSLVSSSPHSIFYSTDLDSIETPPWQWLIERQFWVGCVELRVTFAQKNLFPQSRTITRSSHYVSKKLFGQNCSEKSFRTWNGYGNDKTKRVSEAIRENVSSYLPGLVGVDGLETPLSEKRSELCSRRYVVCGPDPKTGLSAASGRLAHFHFGGRVQRVADVELL